VPGLGARLGRGGATTFLQDMANSDCIVIMGANMAENHPVGFRFVMKARLRGAKLIHIDPRFSRTSAMADMHVPIRAGSDLVFLGALINYVVNSERWNTDPFFREYVTHYTNAPVIVNRDFRDTEDLDGLFSGFDPALEKHTIDKGPGKYTTDTWSYAGQDVDPGATQQPAQDVQTREGGAATGTPWAAQLDMTLEDPFCVFQLVKKHFARYTPEMVERMCGVSQDLFVKVAETILAASGRDRTTNFAYAVAWTQHTIGTQIIGCCAMLQLLLGNVGRPGGGIMALRGHATIQGSTDIPTLYNLLPGYIPMPTQSAHGSLRAFLERERLPAGIWHELPSYMISLLKAWYGEHARPDNDFCFDLLPQIGGDYSFQAMLLMMRDGLMKGLFCMGQNPAVGGQNSILARKALANLDWLVVRDPVEIETAAFWYDAPEVRRGDVRPQDIKTEIFFMPPALTPEKDGSYTNTQRLVQFHDKAVEPPGDARSEAWFIHRLGNRLKELYAADDSPRGRQIRALAWDYPTLDDGTGDPDLDVIVKEINGYTVADGMPVRDYNDLKDDGSTACGCWIYSGIMPDEGRNLSRERRGDDQAALDWGFAWPRNDRILYNRASADPQGRPWSERKKWIWWDPEQERWTGYDVPDFPATKAPDYRPPPGARGMAAHPGDAPFVRMEDGRGGLFAGASLKDGPLPTHYEPRESPVDNLLYPRQQVNPVAPQFERPDNRYHDTGDPRFPYILTTYRLTEHHTAGGMSRWVPWLAELQPEGFAELSPELAAELGIDHTDLITITTLRGSITTRAMVTERMQPLVIDGKRVHQVGLPWHFGFGGIAQGGIANDVSALIEDPNSLIHEAKAFTCSVRKGAHDGGAPRPTDVPDVSGAYRGEHDDTPDR
jgi:formate dehydrogenase major subunit